MTHAFWSPDTGTQFLKKESLWVEIRGMKFELHDTRANLSSEVGIVNLPLSTQPLKMDLTGSTSVHCRWGVGRQIVEET